MKYTLVDILKVCYPNLGLHEVDDAIAFYDEHRGYLVRDVNARVAEGESLSEAIIRSWRDETPILSKFLYRTNRVGYSRAEVLSKNFFGGSRKFS